jgi:hypothetical protein
MALAMDTKSRSTKRLRGDLARMPQSRLLRRSGGRMLAGDRIVDHRILFRLPLSASLPATVALSAEEVPR